MSIWLCITTLAVLSLLSRLVYLHWFHPLAKVPGPWALSISYLPQLFYDGLYSGLMYEKISCWHSIYGPIIRIGPNEVHVDEAKFYNQFHRQTGKLDKDPRIYLAPTATFSITDKYEHDHRRRALEHFYTPEATSQYETLMLDTLDYLCHRLQQDKHANLSNAYRAWSFDTMCRIYLGYNPQLCRRADFGRQTHLAYRDFARMYTLFTFLPAFTVRLIDRALRWKYLQPRRLATVLNAIMEPAVCIFDSIENGSAKFENSILHKILKSDLNAAQKTPEAMQNEIVGNILAGTEAIANTLLTITFYLTQNLDDCKKLRLELQTHASPENSPFLVCNFVLVCMPSCTSLCRLQKGAEFREPRICPERDVCFQTWCIPQGTTISTTPMSLHQDESVFENASEFRPVRWLDRDVNQLKRHLVPFSIGRRQCLGKK
ncbi:cytochrome P450 [Ophiobolus disseminans]|uniref:Cytochrome P450 n=1 Tax=Ophiobolus disseminans TaxID=1469910 RepID=A0A6A6ZIM8_9PLEO|nr:cytochrome P450 [Ophiobolus disseminans]